MPPVAAAAWSPYKGTRLAVERSAEEIASRCVANVELDRRIEDSQLDEIRSPKGYRSPRVVWRNRLLLRDPPAALTAQGSSPRERFDDIH
jgi:hypothetical protein